MAAKETQEFISHREKFSQRRDTYNQMNPYQIPDYTEEHKVFMQKREELRALQTVANPGPVDYNDQHSVPSGMTDLTGLVPNSQDDEDEDILAEIRKDFVSPYEKETASTVMMPASELLEQAKKEAEEDDKQNSDFFFEPLNAREAKQLYTKLQQVFQDTAKEWAEYKEGLEERASIQRFEENLINKTNSIIAQINKLEEKSESFIRNWIQGTLFKLIDELFIMLSKVYRLAYSGNMPAARIRNWLQEILFGRMNDLCVQLQWLSIDMLLPLQSEFDPREHIMCGKQDAGKEFRNFVVGIEQAGFFTYDGSTRVRKARVHVGS